MGERRSDVAALSPCFRHADRRCDRFVDVVCPGDLSFDDAASVAGDPRDSGIASSRHAAPPHARSKDISGALCSHHSFSHR